MPSALLKVDKLNLTSKNGFIVKDLSFEMGQGEIVALTGKSGSGKTSIALALLGMLPAGIKLADGSIQFFKDDNIFLDYPTDAKSWSALRGSYIAFIQQDVFGAFDPIMKMGKQMLMIIRERSRQKEENLEMLLRSILIEVGLPDVDRVLKSYPHQLSGGQLQRCLLCIAILIRPLLIIADEPTSAIDKVNQMELLELFSMIRKKYNISILLITHEKSVVQYLADREVNLEITETDHRSTFHKANDIGVKEPLLEANNLCYSHRYGGLIDRKGAHILNLSFQMFPAECIGVIGESGSGKSTLAQMMVGLLVPSSGNLVLDNMVVDFRSQKELRRLRSKVQLVMQDGRGSLHPNMKAGELLIEIAKLQGTDHKNIEEVIRNAILEVGLPSHVLDRKPANLSGGECLRLSLARALLINPEVLICDESTSALDEATRDGIMNLLASLMRTRKLALMMISHDDYIIRQMADEVLVFSDGQIVEKGRAEVIINKPTHTETKKIFRAQATLSQKKSL